MEQKRTFVFVFNLLIIGISAPKSKENAMSDGVLGNGV